MSKSDYLDLLEHNLKNGTKTQREIALELLLRLAEKQLEANEDTRPSEMP
jgi:hypothetical protein